MNLISPNTKQVQSWLALPWWCTRLFLTTWNSCRYTNALMTTLFNSSIISFDRDIRINCYMVTSRFISPTLITPVFRWIPDLPLSHPNRNSSHIGSTQWQSVLIGLSYVRQELRANSPSVKAPTTSRSLPCKNVITFDVSTSATFIQNKRPSSKETTNI